MLISDVVSVETYLIPNESNIWWEFPSDSKPMHIVAAYFRLVVDNDLWVFCSLAF